MDSLADTLNWKLLTGSHGFPGPDGGTCINEAAIVAAGFAYREVSHTGDLPPCFCPVIGAVSIWLNDSISDPALRMELLLPFVTRLSGTRGDAADEAARLDLLRAWLKAWMPRRMQSEKFSLGHYGHLVLGDYLGPMTVRRFTIDTAAGTREILRIARRLHDSQDVIRLPAFYAGMAEVIADMLAIGPRADPLAAGLVARRLDQVRGAVTV